MESHFKMASSISDLLKLFHNIWKELVPKDFMYLKFFASPPLNPSELEGCEDIFSLLKRLNDKEFITEQKLGWLHVALHELGNKRVLDLLFEYELKRNIGPYKVMLCRLSKAIGNDIFQQLKLLSDLNGSESDEVKTPLELLDALERCDRFNKGDVTYLIDLFRQVEEPKLVKVVREYEEKLKKDKTDGASHIQARSSLPNTAYGKAEVSLAPSQEVGCTKTTQIHLPYECTEPPGVSFSTKEQQLEGSTVPVEKPYLLENVINNRPINSSPIIPAFGLLSIADSSDMDCNDAEIRISGDETLAKTCRTENIYVPKDKVDYNKLHCDQPKFSPPKVFTNELLERENGRGKEQYQQPSYPTAKTEADGACSNRLTCARQQLSSPGNSLDVQSAGRDTKVSNEMATIPASQSSLTDQKMAYTIHCVKCGCQLCTAGDLRSLSSKVIVICDDYRDKVIMKKKVKPTQTRPGYTICKNCSQQLGPQYVHNNEICFCLTPCNVKWKQCNMDILHSLESWAEVPFTIRRYEINNMA